MPGLAGKQEVVVGHRPRRSVGRRKRQANIARSEGAMPMVALPLFSYSPPGQGF